MSLNILITGGTGFIAAEMARCFASDVDIAKIYLLIRPSKPDTADVKFERVVKHWNKFYIPMQESDFSKITVISYDLNSQESFPVIGPVDYFIHSAANTDLSQSLGEARFCNLQTTQRALEVARNLPGLKRFIYMSTAYVAGKNKGLISEKSKAKKFNNFYEQSKYECEDCIVNSEMPFTIIRPSIVVGRSDNGYFRKLKVLYSVWRIWLLGVVSKAPLDPDSAVDFVPVNYVIDASKYLMQAQEALGETFLLCAGPKCVSPYEVMLVAAKEFNVKQPPLTKPWMTYAVRRWPLRLLFSRQVLDVLDTLYHQIHYIGIKNRVFDTKKTEALLQKQGIICPSFHEFGTTMFSFCVDTKWGKKAQILKK